jgi:lysozyme family protein
MFLTDLEAGDPGAWRAITRTLPLEGRRFVNDPADPGGATDRGVSLRFALAEVAAHPNELAIFDLDHDGDVDWHDIAALGDDQAAAVYHQCVWTRYGYGRLIPWLVAWKAFDLCVNTGPRRAALVLQQALGDIGLVVACDGKLGPGTVAATRQAIDLPLLSAMRARQAQFYRDLVAAKPQLQRFAAGWAARAAA